MQTAVIYFTLFAFWADYIYGINLSQLRGVSFTNLAIYFLLVAWLFQAGKRRCLFVPNNINIPLAIVIFFALISVFVKLIFMHTPTSLARELMALKNWCDPFVIFYAVFNIIDKRNTTRLAFLGLILILAFTLITTFLVAYQQADVASVSTFRSRVGGFSNVNEYAGYLVLFIPLLFGSIFFSNNTFIRLVGASLLTGSILGLLLTGSRGGFISFVASLIVYFFVIRDRRSFLLPVATAVVAIMVGSAAFLLMPPETKETFLERLDPRQAEDAYEYTSGRMELWENGLRLFFESPIFGHGHATFTTLNYSRFGIKLDSHNQYITFMVEYGIFGFLAFIFLFARIFSHSLKHIHIATTNWDKCIYAGYFAGFCGYAVSLMGGNSTTPRYIFWIYTAIVYAYSRLQERSELGSTKKITRQLPIVNSNG